MRQADLGRRRLLWALAGVAIALPVLPARAQDARGATVQKAARDWLTLTDRLDGAASRAAAGKKFQDAIAVERWSVALAQVRGSAGALVQRAVVTTRFERTFPGAPDGDYAIVEFRTAFAGKTEALETVSLEHEADGAWRVIGYFIK
jgi:hypothetical protein